MILHRLGRLVGAVLLLAPSLALSQTALQQPNLVASPGVGVDLLPSALTKLYQNDLFLQNLVTSRFSTLGAAALLNVGTAAGTVADGAAFAAEVNRALAAEQANATAISLRAPLASPAFTGIPTVPTAAVGTSTTQAASTAFVQNAVSTGGISAVLYSNQSLTSQNQFQARANINAAAAGINTDITSLNAPALGAATAATATPGSATAQVANTAFVTGSLGNYLTASAASATYAPLFSPSFSGVPGAPTAAAGTSNNQIATTAFVSNSYAPLASPVFTGSPVAPTAAAGNNSTLVATTAYADRSASTARGLTFRNRIVNGNFAINQRGASSASTSYAAGAYVMDRWKAGPAGVTLSFSTAANGDVTVTITAGTLLQVIEGGLYLPEGGSYILSWTGTSTARVYQGAASGTYAVSPIANTALTAGTNVTVEFSTGSVALAQFEPGVVATPFERRDDEIRRCQRYFGVYTGRLQSVAVSISNQYVPLHLGFGAQMRPGTIGVGVTTSATAGSATSYVYVASDPYGADVALGFSAVDALSSATVTLAAVNEL